MQFNNFQKIIESFIFCLFLKKVFLFSEFIDKLQPLRVTKILNFHQEEEIKIISSNNIS